MRRFPSVILATSTFGAAGLAGAQPLVLDGAQRSFVPQAAPRMLPPGGPPVLQLALPQTVAPDFAGLSPDLAGEVLVLAPAAGNTIRSIAWTNTDEGAKYRVEFISRGAGALRLRFLDIPGVELTVYDPATGLVVQTCQSPRLDSTGGWWTTTVFGEAIGVEMRSFAATPPPVPIPVASSHLYRERVGMAPQERGGCHVDLTCEPGWYGSVEDRAVGWMIFVSGEFAYICSGALVNRAAFDAAPVFMTARHCIGTQDEANSLDVFWFYNTDVCDGSSPDPNTLPRNNGALLLKSRQESDFTLVGLYAPDLSWHYIGWNAFPWTGDPAAYSVSHPLGEPKRFAEGVRDVPSDCLPAEATDEWQIAWSRGRTLPGSSGSPLYDSQRRMRGTLSCGPFPPRCPPDALAWYGQFSDAFRNVRYYIADHANPCFVDGAVAGDPGNTGNAERGTSTNPFNTVYEATFAVPARGEVRVAPGTYTERFRLTRPMTLTTAGPGIVTIVGQ